ncbi:GNAT family N-acetyltransferase [Actinacidiphila glaucinigra]|uniref:GNAT family N-acetyltransferase n=1 Tax=Actinacidiphila glaucinigra TaxID=235986 RepID=UPI003D94EE0C
MKSVSAPYVLREGVPSAADYLRLRAAAGLSARTPEGATVGLAATWHAVRVFRGEALVGMGRVIGDGGCFFQIVDICVTPEQQGRGLGKAIIDALVRELERRAPRDAYVSLIADGDARCTAGRTPAREACRQRHSEQRPSRSRQPCCLSRDEILRPPNTDASAGSEPRLDQPIPASARRGRRRRPR